MKKLALSLLVLVLTLSMVFVCTVSATSEAVVETQDGLEVTLDTDKVTYAENEDIKIGFRIRNTNETAVSGIDVQTLLPAGLKLKAGQLGVTDITIEAGEVYEVSDIVAQYDPEGTTPSDPTDPSDPTTTPTTGPSGGTSDNPQTGEGFGVFLFITLMFVAVTGIVLVVRFGHGKKFLCLVLCMAVLLPIIPAQALTDDRSIEVEKVITVGETQYTIKTIVTYGVEIDPNAVFTITFNSNGGTEVESQSVTAGGQVTAPAVPTKTGYVFAGWYKDNDTFQQSFDFATIVTRDITLYAKWDELGGGTAGGTDTSVNVYSITGLEIDKETGTATAIVSAPENCALLVRFIEEDVYFSDDYPANKVYIDNGDLKASRVVAAGSNMATVQATIEGTLPEGFVAEAVLVGANGEELCEPYSTVVATERYDEFSSRTIYDFGDDPVLNFDQQTDDNFGVLADDVKVMSAEDVTAEDLNDDGVDDRYTVDTPSDTIAAGDKLFLRDAEGYFLFRVATIETKDGVLVITPAASKDEELGYGLDEFYKFLKVDISFDEESMARTRTTRAPEARGLNIYTVYENPSASTSLNFAPLSIETEHFKANAGITGTIGAKLVIEWDIVLLGRDYFRCDFQYTLDTTTNLDIVAKVDHDNDDLLDKETKELKFGKVSIPFGVTGLSAFADVKLCVEWELSAGLHAEVKSTTTSGFTYNNRDGYQKVENKDTSWTIEAKGHAELKFGPKPSVGIDFLQGAVAVKLECFFGGVAEADAVVPVAEDGEESIHACYLCVTGNVRAELSVHAKLEYDIGFIEGTPIDWNILTYNRHLFDFYLSLLNASDSKFGGQVHGGRGECPNQSYKTTVYTKDENGQSVSTTVSIYKTNNQLVKTIDGGSYCYLPTGNYVARATINGEACEKSFSVAEGAKTVTLQKELTDGQISGSVLDIETSEGISGATVKVFEYNSCVATATTDASGNYTATLPEGSYKLEVSKEGYITATLQFSLRAGETKMLETLKLTKKDEDRIMGGIYGTIKNGITGATVPDVNIKISKGWGNEAGAGGYVVEKVTNASGVYDHRKSTIHGVDFGLDAGNYTITISKEGFITTSFNITIVGGADMEFNSSITPVGEENMWHIVLTWGATPADLDSHLNATYEGSRDHVYYWDMHGVNDYSYLDVDDISSYGPETVTIANLSAYTGNIMYSVHDYTNRGSSSSTAMSLSGATVKVYRGGQLLETFHISAGIGATVWNVFYINENGQVVPVNTFGYTSDPSAVVGATA